MPNSHSTMQDSPSPHLLYSYIKETPVIDYPPYQATMAPSAHALLSRVGVHVFSVIRYRCHPNWFLDRRTIDERLFYVLRGTCRIQMEDATYEATPGQCIHLHRNIQHHAATDPRNPLEFISLRYNARLFNSLLLDDVFPLPPHIPADPTMPLRATLEEGCRLFALQPPAWQQHLNALGTFLLLWLIREHSTSSTLLAQTGRIADLQRLSPALQTLQRNFQSPPSIPSLARLCSLSPEQFRRIFSRTLGISPSIYGRNMRLEKACYLLHSTDAKIEHIAAQVGYLQLSSFVHAFKNFTGVSPGQFRRQFNGL